MINIPRRGADRHNFDKVHIVGAYYLACWVVDSPIAVELRKELECRLPWRSDHQLPFRTVQVGMIIAAILGRPGQHVAVLDVLKELPVALQAELEVQLVGHKAITYRKIEWTVSQLARILADPPVLVEHDHQPADEETGEVLPCPPRCPYTVADATWYLTGMALAAIPSDIAWAQDMALDWTDDPTWAKQQFDRGCEAESRPGDDLDYHGEAICADMKKKRPKVVDAGSKDPDAKKSHRSPRTNLSEYFIGFNLHTAVGIPGRNGKAVAPFTYGALVATAGKYGGDCAVGVLRAMRFFGLAVNTLVADRGYTALSVDGFSRPVRELVSDIVLDMVEHQRKAQPDYVVVRRDGRWKGESIRAKVIAGTYFSSALPKDFEDLARPDKNANAAAVAASLAKFDFRAQFAFVRHGNTAAGTQRWAGPATKQAGYKVRCPNNPNSFKRLPGLPETRPLTLCVESEPCSCGEFISVTDPSIEREQQHDIWGTTPWTISYNRRTAVERAYADDKYHVGDLARGNIRCFGKIKHAIYYAPMAVARNLQVALRWYHQEGIPDPWDLHRLNRTAHEPAQALAEQPPSPPPVAAQAVAHAAVGDIEDEHSEAPVLTLNRKQRRAAERRGPGRRGTSKPPKPPPKGDPTTDEL